jgi:hypothetical protein
MSGSRSSQAVTAQAIAAGGGHRQLGGFLGAPAIAGEIAAKFGTAGGAGQAAAQRDGAGRTVRFSPICHANGLNFRAIFRRRSSAGAAYPEQSIAAAAAS